MKKILLVGVLALSMPFALLSSSNSVTITNNTPLEVLPKFVTSTDQSFGTAGTVTETTFTSGLTITGKFVEAVSDGYVVAGDYFNGVSGGVVILKYDNNGKLLKEVYPGGMSALGMRSIRKTNNDNRLYILTEYSGNSTVIAFDFNLNYVRNFGTDGYATVGTTATPVKMVANGDSIYAIANDGVDKLFKINASTGTPDSGFTTKDLTTGAFADSVASLTVSNDQVIVAGKDTNLGNTGLRAFNANTGVQNTTSFGTGGVATTGSAKVAVAIGADPSTGDISVLQEGLTTGSAAIRTFTDEGTLSNTFAPGNVIGALSDILVTPEATYVVATNGTNDGVIAVVQNNAIVATITNTALTAAVAATIGTDGKLIVAGNDASNAGLWRINLPVSNPIISNNANSISYGLVGSPA